MPVIGLCVAIIPVIAVLAITAIVKTLLFPFAALRTLHRNRAARAV